MDQVPGCMVTGARARKGCKGRAEVPAHFSCMGLDWLSLLMNTYYQETGTTSLCWRKVCGLDFAFFQEVMSISPPSTSVTDFFPPPSECPWCSWFNCWARRLHARRTVSELTLLTMDILPSSIAWLVPRSLSPEQLVCATPAQPPHSSSRPVLSPLWSPQQGVSPH